MSYEERAALRSRLAYPILVGFEKLLYKNLFEVSSGPKGLLYKVLLYNYTLFYLLSRYHFDGRMKLDNNEAENAIRPLALDLKKILFIRLMSLPKTQRESTPFWVVVRLHRTILRNG